MKIEQSMLHIYPVGQKFRRNRSTQAILSFTIFVKNSKIQNGRHFWKEEKFLRIEQSTLHIYIVGQKFRRNRSILHGLGDTSNFKFYHFCQKLQVQNGRHFWREEIFLELSRVLSRDTLWVKNFAEIALSRTV